MLGASAVSTLGALAPFLLGSQAILIQRDLHFGPDRLGIAVSAFFAAAALITILGSGVLGWLGAAGARLVGGLLVTAGGLGIALVADSWWLLVLGMVILGIGNGACQGSANAAVTSILPQHRRGLGFGIKQSAVPAAIMFGGLAVPTTTALFGWRSTFIVTGSLGLLLVLSALLFVRRSRGSVGTSAATRSRTLDRAPRTPLLLCGLSIAIASAAGTFLGAYLASWGYHVGLTVSQAGLLMALGSGGSIVVRIFSGHRADHRYGGNLALIATQMFAGALCLVMIGILASPWSVIVFGFLAFALGWSWPGLFLYAVARLGRDAPAEASSVVQAGAFGGGALGPLVFGMLVSVVGFRDAWLIAAAIFAVGALFALAARAGFRRDLRDRPPVVEFGYGGGRTQPRYVTGPRAAPGEPRAQ